MAKMQTNAMRGKLVRNSRAKSKNNSKVRRNKKASSMVPKNKSRKHIPRINYSKNRKIKIKINPRHSRKNGGGARQVQLNKFVTRFNQKNSNQRKNPLVISKTLVRAKSQKHYYIKELLNSHTDNSYFMNLFKDHVYNISRSLNLLKTLDFSQYRPNGDPVFLPPSSKKTLVLDLDETLIHCNEAQDQLGDEVVHVTFPSGETVEAQINVRPYCREFLLEMSKHFQVVVFTASHACYANPVIDCIDTDRVVAARMYRNNCSLITEGLWTKDLSVIRNRNLKDVILVDNAVYSFILNLGNGVPIIPYYNNKSDVQLHKLSGFLKMCRSMPDVREIISDYFQ